MNIINKERVVMLLQSQRNQMDQILSEVGGENFRKEMFDAEEINNMIHADLGDIKSFIKKGRNDLALELIESGLSKKWL